MLDPKGFADIALLYCVACQHLHAGSEFSEGEMGIHLNPLQHVLNATMARQDGILPALQESHSIIDFLG